MCVQAELSRPWMIPIIQGYVQIEECPVTFEDDGLDPVATSNGITHDALPNYDLQFKLCLISRRSRYRAGNSLFFLKVDSYISFL